MSIFKKKEKQILVGMPCNDLDLQDIYRYLIEYLTSYHGVSSTILHYIEVLYNNTNKQTSIEEYKFCKKCRSYNNKKYCRLGILMKDKRSCKHLELIETEEVIHEGFKRLEDVYRNDDLGMIQKQIYNINMRLGKIEEKPSKPKCTHQTCDQYEKDEGSNCKVYEKICMEELQRQKHQNLKLPEKIENDPSVNKEHAIFNKVNDILDYLKHKGV